MASKSLEHETPIGGIGGSKGEVEAQGLVVSGIYFHSIFRLHEYQILISDKSCKI